MTFARKVFIPIELTNFQTELLKPLKRMDFLSECEVHFIHVFRTMSYPSVLGGSALVYPIEADCKIIEQSALATLVKISQEALPPRFAGKVQHTVLFHDDAKKKFSSYAIEKKADTIIITTKRKHGLFESSFADYANKHTDCNMIYLKHKE